jgi:GTP pyrophosphokinase
MLIWHDAAWADYLCWHLDHRCRKAKIDGALAATDRQGLLRGVSETLTKEKSNAIAASSLSKQGEAQMRFNGEAGHLAQLKHALTCCAT